MKLAWAAVKTWFAANKLWGVLAILLGSAAFLSGAYIGVTHAYMSVYNRGHDAGVIEVETRYKDRIIQYQGQQLVLQRALLQQGSKYTALMEKFSALEQTRPEEVVKYVREDPQFAAAKRPDHLQQLRVAELQSLRQAAATH